MAAHYSTELFGHFFYSPALSYHQLLDREEELKIFLTRLMEVLHGDFLHFEPMGDALRMQCVFAGYGEDLFHHVCEIMAPAMDGRVEARLLFVHKDLQNLHIYQLSQGRWLEAVLDVPRGPIGRSLPEDDRA